MTDEEITLYKKDNPDKPIRCFRKEYYNNRFDKYGEYFASFTDILLFNKHGELLLQRRSRSVATQPGKLHIVGGHINWGEKPEFTVVHECMEELGASIIVFDKEIYDDAISKLSPYTNRCAPAILHKETFRDVSIPEDNDQIKDRVWIYFGRYDGPTDTPDKSASGYEWMSFSILEEEIKTNSRLFTNGLAHYVKEEKESILEFIKRYTDNSSH